ncbi:hypothetical protein HDV00_001768 [Rhizophlyctis rosea]|nr:hypothetical protein HDV00_001768 [Rhizophlyctis rosea]
MGIRVQLSQAQSLLTSAWTSASQDERARLLAVLTGTDAGGQDLKMESVKREIKREGEDAGGGAKRRRFRKEDAVVVDLTFD